MRLNKLLAVVISTLALVSGCTEPADLSHHDRAHVDAPSIETVDTALTAHERTVVNLSDSAIAKFKEFLATEPTKHIRLSVKRGGSTGFTYDMQIDDSINEFDFVDRSHGFALVVDRKSSIYLEGATIDWQTQPDGQAVFKFKNPNAVEQ